MFTQLIASRPARQRSATGFAASVIVHSLVFGAAIYATLGARPVVDRLVQQHVTYVPPEPPTPPEPKPPVPPQTLPASPSSPLRLTVPMQMPTTLPDIPPVVTYAPFIHSPPTRFVPGGTPALPGSPVEPGGTYLPSQVDVEVAIERGSPMPKFPNALRAMGIEGDARFRFVVDTLGRVELSSVEQVGTTRADFAMAVRQALPRMRFRPARVDGKPVRQLVEFPIVFRLTK